MRAYEIVFNRSITDQVWLLLTVNRYQIIKYQMVFNKNADIKQM